MGRENWSQAMAPVKVRSEKAPVTGTSHRHQSQSSVNRLSGPLEEEHRGHVQEEKEQGKAGPKAPITAHQVTVNVRFRAGRPTKSHTWDL